jgi:hypothetical protein
MVGTQGLAAAGNVSSTSPALNIRTFVVGSTGCMQCFERIYTTASQLLNTSVTFTMFATGATGNSAIFKQWLIRGAHASQAIEGTSVSLVAGTVFSLPTLTPTWGSAKNLWLAGAMHDSAFADPAIPVIRTYPAGYGGASRAEFAPVSSTSTQTSDLAFCSRQLESTAQSGVTFATPFSGNGTALLIALRPLAATGTPVKASVAFGGRLVVSTATDVITADPTAVGDLGSTVIRGEWESADIYPMGTAGAGRHLMVSVIGEIRGFCLLTAFLSYDGGVTWTGTRMFQLAPAFGFSLDKSVTLQWVPKRRKIERVRLKLVMADEPSTPTGATRAFALNQITMWFEDLAGQTRAPTSTIVGFGNRR